jgi:hypothetical protein
MLFACGNPDNIARVNLLDRTSPTLYAAKARGNKQRLAKWMRMPRSSRARLESDIAKGNLRGLFGKKHGIYAYSSGEILGWSLA